MNKLCVHVLFFQDIGKFGNLVSVCEWRLFIAWVIRLNINGWFLVRSANILNPPQSIHDLWVLESSCFFSMLESIFEHPHYGDIVDIWWYQWILVGGDWLPSIFYFPINIGVRKKYQLTNSYFSEGFKPPTSNDSTGKATELGHHQLRLVTNSRKVRRTIVSLGEKLILSPGPDMSKSTNFAMENPPFIVQNLDFVWGCSCLSMFDYRRIE